MENSLQPYSPHPQQQCPQQVDLQQQQYPAHQSYPAHSQQQYPQQPYPLYQTYPPTAPPKKKNHGFAIASFIVSAIAYTPTFYFIISTVQASNPGEELLSGLLTLLVFLYVFLPLLAIAIILAIIGLAVNRTKSALIALLVAIVPISVLGIWFSTL